jgi:hypothetical protein
VHYKRLLTTNHILRVKASDRRNEIYWRHTSIVLGDDLTAGRMLLQIAHVVRNCGAFEYVAITLLGYEEGPSR